MEDSRIVIEATVGALVTFLLGLLLDVFDDPMWAVVYILGAVLLFVAVTGDVPGLGKGRKLVWQQSVVFATLGLAAMVVSAFSADNGGGAGPPPSLPAPTEAVSASADRPPGCTEGNKRDAEEAAERTREISVLEAARDFDALYDLMHPDAQAVLPREVVVGWYREDFRDRRTAKATIFDVCFTEWTWAKTCKSYPNTAVVLFKQPFWVHDERQPDPDKPLTLHLVRSAPGDWRWFLGRTREFVDQQIAKFAPPTASPAIGAGLAVWPTPGATSASC
jgi:hypothetical protein